VARRADRHAGIDSSAASRVQPKTPAMIRPRRAGFLSTCILAFAAAACAPAEQRATDPLAAPLIDIESDLRIDGYEADLVPIEWVGIAPSGRIALLQAQDHVVRFFTGDGSFLGAAGGEGDGPGEFRSLARGGWHADTLWVSDPRLGRVTFIAPSLEVVGTAMAPRAFSQLTDNAAVPFAADEPYAVLHGDTMLVTALRMTGSRLSTAAPSMHLLRVVGDSVLDVVAPLPADEGGEITIPSGRGYFRFQVPFFARSDWAVSSDGRRVAILTTDTSDPTHPSFRVRITDAAGHALVDRTFPFEPDPIPPARMDSAIAASAAPRPELRTEMERELRRLAPRIHAAAERVLLGEDGTVWIGLRQTTAGRPWLLLGPDGAPAGRIVLPANATLRVAERTRVWVTERDELDVESIVRYRLDGR
jgi:hypothetical protein